ncbi:phospholipase D family protein [Lysobacter brunescens]|uniref:Phospholipase D family protein n=1 Tax=Lysobacter brunescens TaxID=262323 RepID=A0ABW2Y7W8_9GAMM
MTRWTLCALAVLAFAQTACSTLSEREHTRVVAVVEAARSAESTCDRADACARPSPLRELGERAQGVVVASSSASQDADEAASDAPAAGPPDADAGTTDASTAEARAAQPVAAIPGSSAPQHYALILDYGQDALLARLDLIRGAQRSIDIQTYIFDEDDAGHLILDELLAAARRGVKVRLLADQLAALKHVDTVAALAGAHRNFEMRVYNPVLGRARFGYPMYAVATLCCFRRLNQRMHNKLMVVDGLIAITGGRNYQNDYFDWDARYNFRDRDILVAGPSLPDMAAHFEAFWNAPLSTPLTKLSDVGRLVLKQGVPPVRDRAPEHPRRLQAIGRDADDAALVRERLVDAALPVRHLRYIGDPPEKHDEEDSPDATASSRLLRDLIVSAQDRVLLQTPYLVMSKPAQRMFLQMQARPKPPRVQVSTNSLAATDAFIPYALSYKYKRRYLRDYKFEIHEFKPFPQDAPIDVEATGTVDVEWLDDGTPVVQGVPVRPSLDLSPNVGPLGSGSSGGAGSSGASAFGGSRSPDRPTPLAREYSALRYSKRGSNEPVPLKRGGVRFGLHAKSLVIDDRVGVIGTHNFDPRGDHYNTEAVVVIDDPVFARQLADSIERDMRPENAWVIAPRDKPPVFSGLEYSLAKISEHLPVFDFWPVRYATSYEFKPGPDCPKPLSPRDPKFRACHEPVGDFPEVDMLIRPLTRIFTAFGAGLAPIL